MFLMLKMCYDEFISEVLKAQFHNVDALNTVVFRAHINVELIVTKFAVLYCVHVVFFCKNSTVVLYVMKYHS